MRKIFNKIILNLVIISMIITALPVFADSKSSFDVVFVIDNSGSMRKSDPERLALKGAELFVDLLSGTNSRAGYVMFTEEIVGKRNLEIINGNENLRKSFEETNYTLKGDTDIGLGLATAFSLFDDNEKFKDNKKIVVLLSDGKPDVKGKTSEELYISVDNELTNFSDEKIPVYSIALNNSGTMDIDLMKSIAKDTSATFYEVKENTDLPDTFMQIYINLLSGKFEDSLTDEGKLTINANVSDVYVVLIPACDAETDAGFTKIQTDSYTVYKQSNPLAGTYKFVPAIENAEINVLTIEKNSQTFTVNFDTDGGTEMPPVYVTSGSVLTAETPSKTGYAFKNWTLDDQEFDLSTPIESDITLKAVWGTAIVPEKTDVSISPETEEKSEVKMVPVIIFSGLLLFAIFFCIFFFPRHMRNKIFGLHPLVSGVSALILNVAICVSIFMIFKNLFSPLFFENANAKKTFYEKPYEEVYKNYYLITGLLLPFLYNFVCAYALPALTSNLLKVKKMQCRIFTVISAVGIVFPLYFWYVCAFSAKVFLMYLLLYIFVYIVNFILCSLCVRFTYGKYFRFIA